MRSPAGILLAALVACGGADAGSDAPNHITLQSIDTLRARFRADSGKVRAILLGAPT